MSRTCVPLTPEQRPSRELPRVPRVEIEPRPGARIDGPEGRLGRVTPGLSRGSVRERGRDLERIREDRPTRSDTLPRATAVAHLPRRSGLPARQLAASGWTRVPQDSTTNGSLPDALVHAASLPSSLAASAAISVACSESRAEAVSSSEPLHPGSADTITSALRRPSFSIITEPLSEPGSKSPGARRTRLCPARVPERALRTPGSRKYTIDIVCLCVVRKIVRPMLGNLQGHRFV
jgi:hypothetical protein